ncbi:FAD-dependent oxidoreductase [Alloscardovia omnicolens]|uniref:FAD-dependent oxidoreductase n=1 Tax=Alloscardovia omnicolens TaxID=419015 RepID=UPI003A71562F
MTTVAVIGCTHAGTFATSSILAQHPDWTVHVFERNDSLSFLSCGIALWVGNHVSDPQRMFYSSPEALTEAGATMHMRHDVLDVSIDDKRLHARDLETGEVTEYTFDKLVVTTGSAPVLPPIDGLAEAREAGTVLLCKNWDDALTIKERVKDAKSAVIIGAGYIGAELAEQLSEINVKATLVDALDHVLQNNFDSAVSDLTEKAFEDHGVTLALGQKVIGFRPTDDGVTVVTEKGEYTADFAVMGAGFRPHNDLIQSQLRTLDNGAIIVDEYMRASLPDGTVTNDVLSAGDSATVFYNPTQAPDYIPLATNAVRQGLLIGENIVEPTHAYLGTQATSAVQLYDLSMCATGLTYASAVRRGYDAGTVTITEDYRPDFMLTTTPVTSTLVWDKATGRILGAQFISKHDISQAANVVSVAIQAQFSIADLAGADLLFQPNFSQPINFVGSVAIAATQQK